jgi:uncharacterized RDD family membrane protein YckC
MSSQLAPLRRRMASLLYESLVVFSILLIGFLLPQAFLAGFLNQWGFPPVARNVLVLHIFWLLLVYFVWFWLQNGQTLPMKTWKLRLVNEDGHLMRPSQAVFRYMLAWLGIFLLGGGFLWALVDKDKQFLHDRIAGSRIVSTQA